MTDMRLSLFCPVLALPFDQYIKRMVETAKRAQLFDKHGVPITLTITTHYL
jgi:hypothetical protein